MRSDKFQNALGMVDPGLVKRASGKPQRLYKYRRTIVSVAAVLAIAIVTGAFWWIGSRDGFGAPSSWWNDEGESENYDPQSFEKYLLLAAEYPVMAKLFGNTSLSNEERYNAWKADRDKQKAYFGAGAGLESFFEKSTREFLLGRGDANSVYSPLNVYFSIAMMAELATEEDREPIFSLLGVDSIEELRTQANSIWNANYCDDGVVKSVLANSIWTDKDIAYNEELLNVFRDSHKASVFQGDFGSSEYDFALRSWINENTDGLVDRLSDVSLDPSAVLALVSTITFSAKWIDEFQEEKNEDGLFHSPQKDVNCVFMNMKTNMEYYAGKGFSSVKKDLINTGSVYFVLPDENVSIDTLLYNTNVLSILSASNGWDDSLLVKLSVPKFEIQSDMDLSKGLENLGVSVNGVLGVRHGAGVSMDEEGVKAAAFTMGFYGAGLPENEIEFVLDSPFMFIITGNDGLPLFVGIVNQP